MRAEPSFGPLFGPDMGVDDLAPPVHAATAAERRLGAHGFCVLPAVSLAALGGLDAAACAEAAGLWSDLPTDVYLKDGGHYRSRRHGSFIQTLQPELGQTELMQAPHRAHYQPETYNALHGGLVRWYAPLAPHLIAMPGWDGFLTGLGRVFAGLRATPQWFIEAHQFRIDTEGGMGRPTPEGAHRDGVDFVAVILVRRQAIRGGETRVFELDGARGVRFTLDEPWSVLLMDDTRVIHESTPIMPVDPAQRGWRDTLVLTYRAGGFMEPQNPAAS